jgi:hypothetical protein
VGIRRPDQLRACLHRILFTTEKRFYFMDKRIVSKELIAES